MAHMYVSKLAMPVEWAVPATPLADPNVYLLEIYEGMITPSEILMFDQETPIGHVLSPIYKAAKTNLVIHAQQKPAL